MRTKKFLGAAIYLLLLLLQLGLVYGLRMLDYLSTRKAGVNHHLMVRKSFYDYRFFTQTNRIILLVLIAAVLGVLLYCFLKGKRNAWSKFSLVTSIGIGAFGAWALLSKVFGAKLFFPYAMAGIGVLFVLELLKLFISQKLLSRDGLQL